MTRLLIIVAAMFTATAAAITALCILASMQEHKESKNISLFRTEPDGIRWAIIDGELIEETVNG